MIDIGMSYRSPGEGGQYMVDRDVRDNGDGSETTVYAVYFRKDGVETWEYVNCWETRADAEAYVNGALDAAGHELARAAKKTRRKTMKRKYEYVMRIRETVESTVTVRSERKLTFDELEERAERRRVNGTAKFDAVTDVNCWCESAKENGKEDRDAIAR